MKTSFVLKGLRAAGIEFKKELDNLYTVKIGNILYSIKDTNGNAELKKIVLDNGITKSQDKIASRKALIVDIQAEQAALNAETTQNEIDIQTEQVMSIQKQSNSLSCELSTKSVGKKAIQEIKILLPEAAKIKRHDSIMEQIVNIYDKNDKHLGYATYKKTNNIEDKNAVLVVFVNSPKEQKKVVKEVVNDDLMLEVKKGKNEYAVYRNSLVCLYVLRGQFRAEVLSTLDDCCIKSSDILYVPADDIKKLKRAKKEDFIFYGVKKPLTA